jgi:hypothetical protein
MNKKTRPYELKQGDGGLFVSDGSEPIDSPVIGLRLPKSEYDKLLAMTGGGPSRLAWIRQAIAEKLQRESAAS